MEIQKIEGWNRFWRVPVATQEQWEDGVWMPITVVADSKEQAMGIVSKYLSQAKAWAPEEV